MANSVDLIIGAEAIKSIEKAISLLSLADQKIIDISQSSLIASKSFGAINTPSGLDKAVTNTSALNTQLEKQNAIITKLHADIAKKAEQSRLSEIRLQQAREKTFDSFEKNAQKEQAIQEKNASAYNKTQTQINNLTKVYNDLALRKERYNNLSANEEMRLNTLAKVTEKYNGILKQTDATIGKNQRNVGNYASGYNALGNSINQLSREAPAFANSVNTGFMALSNNFPALFDAINGIRNQNKALVAEGKPTTSLFKQLVSGIFSWQTALSVGVTLLTLYGGKIVEFIGNAMRGKEAIKTLAENQKLLNDTLKESSGSYAEEKVNIEVLYKTATNLNASYKDRKQAVDELQRLYPFYFKNLTDEEVMVGKAKDQYNLLSQAIITTAKARAAESILQKRESERLIIEEEDLQRITKKYGDLKRAKYEMTTSASVGVGGVSTLIGKEEIRRGIQQEREASLLQREQWAKEDAFFIKKVAEGNAIEQTLKPAEKAKKEKIKKDKEARREDIVGLENHIKTVGTLVDEIDTEINRLTTEQIVANEDELPAVNFQLEQLLLLKKQLNEVPSVDFKIDEPVKAEDIEKVKEMTEAIKSYLSTFESEFMSNSGFSETFDLLSKKIEGFGENFAVTFNAIAESAQEAFNFISNASQANFDDEYARLESQKEVSLKYAGDSASARTKIEEDVAKKKKEIANRENRAKKTQAIFNIAIDTAQAIVATLAKTPPPAGLPLAFLMGALGAVQIGLVASQKVPQYFEGTNNHVGGLMLVNDGAGSNFQEKVILPNGKEIMPEGRNVLMNAPAGTKVLTHEQQIMQMLNERGVSMSKSYQSNGMTANEMDVVLSKHFGKIQTNHTSIDHNGIRSWSESNGNKTIRNNNRVSRTGYSV
jgi:hypothetical protein